MLIVTDIDDCVLGWHEGFIRYAGENGFVINPDHPQDTYDMHDWFINMSKHQFHGLVYKFNEMYACTYLKPYADVLEYLPKLAEEHTIVALTAYGDSPDMIAKRVNVLNNLFPNVFDDIHVLGLGECKRDMLQKLKPDLFIEDSARHAQTAVELGIETILISTSYNQGVTGVEYVSEETPWKEITAIVETTAALDKQGLLVLFLVKKYAPTWELQGVYEATSIQSMINAVSALSEDELNANDVDYIGYYYVKKNEFLGLKTQFVPFDVLWSSEDY